MYPPVARLTVVQASAYSPVATVGQAVIVPPRLVEIESPSTHSRRPVNPLA